MIQTIDLHHSFDAKLAKNIGEQSVSSNIQAVIELIKNSYDADSTECVVHFVAKSTYGEFVKLEKIIVEDNGIGMSCEDIEGKWMRVATPNKEKDIESVILKRRVAGEKGMGRFASQRLGNVIKIISNPEDYTGRQKSKYTTKTLELTINWNDYQSGKNFDEIPNKLKILDTSTEKHGFRIEITDLKGQWTINELDDVMVNAGTLISPKILKDSDKNSFDVKIVPHNFKLKRDMVENVVEKFAPWEIKAQIRGSKLNYQILKRNVKTNEERKAAGILSKTTKDRDSISLGTNLCGDVDLSLLIYRDKTEDWAPKSILQFSELGKQLAENEGVKIFNDGVRIMPYGKKGDDWLGLDKRWMNKMGGKTRVRNMIGYVFLKRKNNPQIIETTTREGLVQNSSFKFLKEIIVIKALERLEEYRREETRIDDAKKKITRPSAIATVEIKQLSEFIQKSGLKSDEKKTSLKSLNVIGSSIVKSDKLLKVEKDSFTSRSTMYRNLASLGISSLAFHHEIKQHVGRIGSGLSLVIDNWDDWDDDDKIEMLEDAKEDIISIKELNGYIREFASLFRGIRGAKRSKEIIDFKKSVENFKKGFKELLKISEIQIECIMGPGRFSNMHLNLASWESIMLNLIANSIKALDDVTRRKKFIKISFDKTEHDLKILIRDNGKGIPEDDYYRVFEPLWTTYKGVDDAGTGMGMPIVKEIIEVECGGEIFVKTSRAEKILPGEGGTTIQINIPLQYLQET